MNTKGFLITVGISGALCIFLGSFGSHLLNGNISEVRLEMWDTALLFQMFSTIALLAITFMNRYLKRFYVQMTYYFFVFGIMLFSGPLYLNAALELVGINFYAYKYFTPIGIILLMTGWVFITIAGVGYKHNKQRPKHLKTDEASHHTSHHSSHRHHESSHSKDN